MAHRKTSKRSKARTMLRLADLEQSKNAVLHSLGAPSSQESYGHAIDEFIGWYCSEPRLSFNRTVVLRYRFFLEQKKPRPFLTPADGERFGSTWRHPGRLRTGRRRSQSRRRK